MLLSSWIEIIETAKFTCFPIVKALEKQTEKQADALKFIIKQIN